MQMNIKEFVELKGDELTPYATVTKFVADTSYETKDKSSEAVLQKLGKDVEENSIFCGKISGLFKNACTYDAGTRATLYTFN